ncbi:SusC/RagA family TonB-linked outer membrane protein [Arachidicoccus ginsenosidimutans]|uniref:SusC/RagA family TonB-linked outer membrane protein n=1 Tax=Arachidicoccus sp. BS20 TaxID=1850526 RepID=UPI0018D44DF1|nr:SusC/RagA family TonB-linked outer membrane protein [Arachidicoccus sp. BS20]
MSKLTLCLIIFFNIHATAKVYSQTRVTLNVKSAGFKEIASRIEKQSSYRFVFSERKIPSSKKFDVNVHDMPVHDLLNMILKSSGYSYKEFNDGLIVIVPVSQNANQIALTGKVVNESGSPLGGVTVKVKGNAKLGVVTDMNGIFSINVPNDAVLEINYVGYQSKEVTVNGQTSLNISLTPINKDLNDVVVVGYGTQKKLDLTGAVSSVSGKDVNWKPVGQLSESLQGMMPGVTITQGGGQPGVDQGTIRIRGIGTLNDNSPLVLVDGVQSDINDVDPNDVASISVLKDAAAASIYGVRAANGVIIITTKRGESGKAKLAYSNDFGWQKTARLSKFVGAQEYMKLTNLMHENSGGGDIYTADDIAAYNNANRNTDKYPDNYWLKDILTGNGFQQQHSVSLSGGNDNAKYRLSTNYFDQNGLISNMDYERLTIRLNTNIKVNDKLSVSADIAARIGDRTEPQDIGGSGSAWSQFGQAAVMNPLIVNKYSDGTWGIGRGDGNPIRLQQEGGISDYKDNLITGNFRGDYEIIKGLTLSGIVSANYETQYNSLHTVAMTYYDFFNNHAVIATKGLNAADKQSDNNWFKNYQGLLTYTHQFGSHSLTILGGMSKLTQRDDYLEGYRSGIPSSELDQLDAGATSTQTNNGTAGEYGLLSYFGRVNYAYKEKYLFEANLRNDGSSRFAQGQKWGLFPSFSAGWRISSEDFMRNVKFVQNLKLRGSWGELGNDAIGNYPYQSIYDLSHNYPFGGTLAPSSGLSTYPNSRITWETTKMTDIGLDFTTLSGKLNVTYDWYNKKTDNILLKLPILESVGLAAPYQNAGVVQNKGWELNVTYNNRIGSDFKYNITANLSDVKNKILDLKGADQITTANENPGEITTGKVTGQPIDAYFGYISQGIFQSESQVANHAFQSSQTGAGDLIYKDIDGNDTVNANDRVYLGSNIPRYTFGLNIGMGYKGFDLTAFFQGVGKVSVNTVVMRRAPINSDGNFKAIHEDSWTPENTDATFPRIVNTLQNYSSSSYWIQNGAYVRLKSLQLGYKLPSKLLSKAGVSNLRVFVSGQNLFTWSKLESDIDPEAPNENRYYPQVKVYTFGINVNF